jgi:hypothetical protein
MFLLGIFLGVLLCIVDLMLFQYHRFWIIDSVWLNNFSTGREGTLAFLLKVWSRLLEGVGFYTIGFPELVHETFMDMNNYMREKPVHKKVMEKFLEDTNQGTPTQGYSFSFLGNVGDPLMATLNIHGLKVGLPIWLWTSLNVLNSLDASYINTVCHGHRMDVYPLSSAPMNFAPYFSPSFGESLGTSNQKSKMNNKRKCNKKKSPNYASHVGELYPTSIGHVVGKKPTIVNHARRKILVTMSHTSISSPSSVDHVGDLSKTFVTHVDDKKPITAIHVGGKSPVTSSHIGKMSPTSESHVGDQRLASTIHVGRIPLDSTSHDGGIDTVEKPIRIGHKPKFPCNICEGDHLTHQCPEIQVV